MNELASCNCSIAILLPLQPLLRYNRHPWTTEATPYSIVDPKSTAQDPVVIFSYTEIACPGLLPATNNTLRGVYLQLTTARGNNVAHLHHFVDDIKPSSLPLSPLRNLGGLEPSVAGHAPSTINVTYHYLV